MDIKQYRYPEPIQIGKVGAKVGAVLFLIIFIVILTQPYFRQTYSSFDYYILLIALFLGIVGCIFYVGLFADIGFNDDGLYVDFFGKQYKVFWSDITSVKPFGPRFLHYWVVTTDNKLTLFHRLYGIYSLTSLAPSFCIYKITKGQEFLLMRIKEKIKLNNKAK